jgi:uncharacterized membrane protein
MVGVAEGATRRFLFIDLYRSAVILLMLEGHVLRTLLTPDIQGSAAFQLHEFLHGLSAPAFLFGAGLTFVISTRKRWEAYHHWGSPLSRRVRRLLLVFSLGLALHLPYFSIRKIIIDGTLSDQFDLFRFDVLHCIGVGLLLLHALIFFFKTEVRFYGLVLATIVSVCFLTPLVWDVDVSRFFWPPIAQMFNGGHGSPFPLFPYIGFLFTGVIVSWEYLIAYEQQREQSFMVKLYFLGSIFVFCGMLFDLLPLNIYSTYNYWFTSPNYFFVRIGSLMILLSLFWYAGRGFRRIPKMVTVLGVESLFVYVLHLVVIYGSVINPEINLQALIGNTLRVVPSVGIYAAMLLVMLLLASGWNILKERYYNYYRLTQIVGASIFLILLFTRDF